MSTPMVAGSIAIVKQYLKMTNKRKLIKIILIRHGETEWVRQRRYQGSTDIKLNSRGIRQARALARLLKKERPLAVYSSELSRAYETAQQIARACQQRTRVDQRLNEVSFGRWEGELHAGISERFPKAARNWYEARWASKPPGGESLGSLKKRVSGFLKDISQKFSNRDGTYIIITHGGPIRMFLIELLKIDPKIFWNMRIDPASVTVITISSKREELVVLNSQAHLNGLATHRY